jgi:hypothetical protein
MTEPFRVYIAAASTSDQIDRASRWAIRLSKAGVRVVSTWTHNIRAVGAANPRDATVDQRRQWSLQCFTELATAHALWLLCPPPGIATRGAWVELGAAHHRLLTVSSGDTAQSIFTALGAEYATDEMAFAALLIASSAGMALR